MRGRAARAPRPDRSRLRPARATPTERWLSGRKHRTRNAAYGQPYRGFESHPLRHLVNLLLLLNFRARIFRRKSPLLALIRDLREVRHRREMPPESAFSLSGNLGVRSALDQP